MKIQKVQNNKQSFGMALKIKKEVYELLTKTHNSDKFMKALPALKKEAETVDITVTKPEMKNYDFLDFLATPINKLKINNAITRNHYRNKNMLARVPLHNSFVQSSEDFVLTAQAAKRSLSKKPEENRLEKIKDASNKLRKENNIKRAKIEAQEAAAKIDEIKKHLK